jgi:outer membrane protein assembly factor BamD (BamD/ComL family)
VRGRDLDLDAERAIVADARGALARGDADAALATLGRHERQFVAGRLSEERESLLVAALVRAGRQNEARVRAARFRALWPSSMYLPVVEEALRSIP